MSSAPSGRPEDQAVARQRFLSLFLRSEREVFRYLAALVPNVADAEDIVQQRPAHGRSSAASDAVFALSRPQMTVTDLGTSFGLDVKNRRAELHVFKGSVELQPSTGTAKQRLPEGAGVVIENSRPPRPSSADPARFAP